MEKYQPQTLIDAIDWLYQNTSLGLQRELASLPESELGSAHFGFGLWLRNNLAIGRHNNLRFVEMLEDNHILLPSHDGISSMVTWAFWRSLQGDIGQHRLIELFFSKYQKIPDPIEDCIGKEAARVIMEGLGKLAPPPANKRVAIMCADIGSVRSGNFGWYGINADGEAFMGDSSSIEQFAIAVAMTLSGGDSVALGFECPLFVPLRDDPMLLTKARNGEGNRSWSAGAGCGVLATGLVEVAWILSRIRAEAPANVKAFLDWRAFQISESPNSLFLWEAFVSRDAKGNGHAHDAYIAVQKFQNSLPNLMDANAITEKKVLSLIGAALIRAGWSTDLCLLFSACPVIRA